MGSLAYVARAQARRRWRALLFLGLFVGLMGGLSLSLIAGSRRSATVVDRYLASARQYDLQLFTHALDRDQVLALPGVVRADTAAYLGMVLAEPDGGSGPGINGIALDLKALDPTWRIVDGSAPDPSDPSQVLVNEFFVEQFGRSVGDTVRVQMFARDQAEAVQSGVYEANGPRFRFRISGVARPPQDVAVDEVESIGGSSVGSSNGMAVSSDFYEEHRDEFLDFGAAFNVKLADPRADRDAFVAAAQRLTPDADLPSQVGPVQETARRESLSAPVDLETTALLALGLSLAAAAAIATALVLRAEQRTFDRDTPTLRGLGLAGPQLGLAAVLRTAPVAIGGSLLAIGIALALSARFPIGIGRQLELEGGFHASVVVLALGAAGIVALVAILAFVLGLPRRDRRALPSTRRTMARWLAASGAPTNLVLGTQLAFERGRGVRAVPSRAAIVAGAGALAVVIAIALYVGGVDRLYAEPAARGWRWDAAIGNVNFPLADSTEPALAADDRFRHRTLATYGDVAVNDRATEVLVFDADGDAPPEIVAGRLPETATEIALGRVTLDDLGVDVGDTVRFAVGAGELSGEGRTPTRRMRVVGEALAPVLGEAEIGDVGLVTSAGLVAAGGNPAPKFVFTRLRDGPRRADLLALRRDYTEEIITDAVPARIVNLYRVRRLPLFGILVAGFLGTVVLAYTLAISGRVRSRELAVMRAMGLPSRRIRGVLGWQGAVLGLGILVFGFPIGLLLGVAAWQRVATGLGVDTTAVVSPWVWPLVPLALLVAVGASIIPARRARRAPVADVLRAE